MGFDEDVVGGGAGLEGVVVERGGCGVGVRSCGVMVVLVLVMRVVVMVCMSCCAVM